MDIFLPEIFYKTLPLLCIVLAIFFAFMPASTVKMVCISYLLCYAGYITFKRNFS
ncbi:MAG: hypothetical protein HQK70_11535 [Desulfamplus sp.]|nr:hypothetical protein [Desulfamplus sp.]